MVDLLDLLRAQWILLASTNGCKFAWKPPKDDGGCPIEDYIVEKFDVDNGIWSLVRTSPTCDITCNNLEPGKNMSSDSELSTLRVNLKTSSH